MPVRGEGDGLAARLAHLEEVVRGLQRLPGAVIQPEIPAPVVTEITNLVPAPAVMPRYARAGQFLTISAGSGAASVSLDWTGAVFSPDSLLVVDAGDSSRLEVTVTGLYLITHRAQVTDAPLPDGEWFLSSPSFSGGDAMPAPVPSWVFEGTVTLPFYAEAGSVIDYAGYRSFTADHDVGIFFDILLLVAAASDIMNTGTVV